MMNPPVQSIRILVGTGESFHNAYETIALVGLI
ncbi:hypothetical protein C5167_020512 [Papaver somniferum]|uniref:Uncharacterized protein n=1 Tax=Papaver somniferum TaxID=3469 RepID=A0A4Y7IWH2_PAPSO|nr:hypothetical protein C5167_020512 [Papaver somniferum]